MRRLITFAIMALVLGGGCATPAGLVNARRERAAAERRLEAADSEAEAIKAVAFYEKAQRRANYEYTNCQTNAGLATVMTLGLLWPMLTACE